MEKEIYCPYCGSKHFHPYGNRYECEEEDCQRIFDEEDIVRETLRHRISAILSSVYATEDNPIKFVHPIGEWDEENVGLSSLDLPWCNSVFEFQDGTIWFNCDGLEEPINFDDICTHDLQDILSCMWEEVQCALA